MAFYNREMSVYGGLDGVVLFIYTDNYASDSYATGRKEE